MSRPRLYEVVGGPLDGDVVRLPSGTVRYVHVATGASYAVRWWVKQDEIGLEMWRRACLVYEGGTR